ncbi:MAG: ADP-ribosylglycohydrolase family protein [Trueperaceae bacterium]
MSGSVRGVVRAMVHADGLAWQNLYRRAHLLPAWTRRKRREIEAEHEARGIIDEPLPFALNQPTAPFLGTSGVHTEWLAFQLQVLIEGGGRYDRRVALEAWRDLAARRADLRLSVGQHAALENVAAGIDPPTSGHDNPHYFDDSACFRAVALLGADGGSLRGGELQEVVASDAQISNAFDGIWAAQAFAAALRGALDGADAGAAVAHARAGIPEGTWLAIEVDRARTHAAEAASLFDLIRRLAGGPTNHAYDYGNSAPETLAIALAILEFTGGDLEPGLLAALALPRTAASVAPMIGALVGALGGALGTAHEHQLEDAPLQGLALPHLAGTRPLALLAELRTSTS